MKFAVIGCGNIAQKSSIPALISSGASSISVCVDKNAELENVITSRFGLKFEVSFEKALTLYDFDAVYISTPIGTHKDIILQAVKHKKHVLCEKSIVTNTEEAKQIVEASKRNGVAVFEGFMYQFHTQHKYVKDIIDSGVIGEPFLFQGWFGFPPLPKDDFRYKKELGGGVLLDAASYTIHAARNFFNREPINGSSKIERNRDGLDIRLFALLDFGENCTANLVSGFNNMYQNKYSIWATEGIITLSRAFAVPPNFNSTLIIEKQDNREKIKMDSCNHFIEEIIYFVQNFKEKSVREEWREEIMKQISALDLIKKWDFN